MQINFDFLRWVHVRGFDTPVAVTAKVRCYPHYFGQIACPINGKSCFEHTHTNTSEGNLLKALENATSKHIREAHKL